MGIKDRMSGVELAVLEAGSQSELAANLDVSQQFISKALRQGFLPPKRAEQVEALYGIPRCKLVNPELLDRVGAKCP
jgi:hypothetical protein